MLLEGLVPISTLKGLLGKYHFNYSLFHQTKLSDTPPEPTPAVILAGSLERAAGSERRFPRGVAHVAKVYASFNLAEATRTAHDEETVVGLREWGQRSGCEKQEWSAYLTGINGVRVFSGGAPSIRGMSGLVGGFLEREWQYERGKRMKGLWTRILTIWASASASMG